MNTNNNPTATYDPTNIDAKNKKQYNQHIIDPHR